MQNPSDGLTAFLHESDKVQRILAPALAELPLDAEVTAGRGYRIGMVESYFLITKTTRVYSRMRAINLKLS